MKNITLDVTKAVQFLAEGTVKAYEPKVREAQDALEKGTCPGNDFLGWLHLPSSITPAFLDEIQACADVLRENCEAVVVAGIGGSYLGARAVIEALSNSFAWLVGDKKNPTILFAGNNIGEDYLSELTEYLKNKKFGELNVDAMLSLSNLFVDDIAKFNVYLFAGPTVNFSRTGTKFAEVQDANVFLVENEKAFKLRAGATAGLGLAYSITDAFALGLEGRFAVTPSMFGDADAYRKAAGNARFTVNGIWTIGGQRGKVARAAAAAAAAGYITKEAAEAMVDEALEKNPKIVEKVVEKEVVKYVDKVVYKDAPVSTPVFFQIGKSNIDSKDKARIKLLAEAINAAQEQCTYEVAGYADKKTGSAKYNQQLSEKRAQAVYDLLVEYGVAADKLEVKGYGGVEPMFDNNDTLSRCVIVKKK